MVANTRRGPKATGTPELDAVLQALRGEDALVILRKLADRDPQWARAIKTMAMDLLSAVDAGDVAAEVLAELESLSVEDVWDRAGPHHDGYSDPCEVATEMIDEALEPYTDQTKSSVSSAWAWKCKRIACSAASSAVSTTSARLRQRCPSGKSA